MARSGECVVKKSQSLGRKGRHPSAQAWAQAIERLRLRHALSLLLDITKMARSTFYHRLAQSRAPDKHAALRRRILALFNAHKGRYGYRRITLALHNEGYAVNHKRVERIMREVEIKSEQRKVRYRSYKGEIGRIAPNLLQREFAAEAPNRKWATDVTQVSITFAPIGAVRCKLQNRCTGNKRYPLKTIEKTRANRRLLWKN